MKLRELSILGYLAASLALSALHTAAFAQNAASSPAASSSKPDAPAKRPKRHLLTRTPPSSNVPKSNDPTSPRNTQLGATGDGSGADAAGGPAVKRRAKAASAATP